MDTSKHRLKQQRAFLDAAANGDVDVVDGWLSSDAGGGVNVKLGEGWTALLYAVAHSRLSIVRRLLEEEDIDLNTTTIAGSSALTLAITRKNNAMLALLLTSGASRATISIELWQEVQEASWIRADVRLMLSPNWAVVWSPALHQHFPPHEREKCRLVIYANTLALRWQDAWIPALATRPSSPLIVSWKEEAMRRFWWIVAALTRASGTDGNQVRWQYLAPPLVYHILEFAVFLW
ncbi:hypothetical protein PF008_g10675 [Phytophthora fragariae]|uniref:Uncharacterized protein n=1 Tax=Phytophthora fragariae TaxID=53985 RepID=A0A6G0RUH3_9STRA|nr:hypothetical protein PF008_g10675 [Phytophthora fragariae]